MAPRGSNAPGGLLGPYRCTQGTLRPLPGTLCSTGSSGHGAALRRNGALGSMALFPSGQRWGTEDIRPPGSCIFGSSSPVARGPTRASRTSVG